VSITYTNHFKTIYDEIKARIVAEIPRFGGKNRCLFRQVNAKDLGSEDTIFIKPSVDNEEMEDTGGRTSAFIVELIYLKKMHPELDYDQITDVGEHLKKLFGAGNYRHHPTYWHYCNVANIDYDPELPEEIINTYGFKMTLEIHKSQY